MTEPNKPNKYMICGLDSFPESDSVGCEGCAYILDCHDCTFCFDCFDCNDCFWCDNCIGCTGQRGRSFMVDDKQLSEADYKIAAFDYMRARKAKWRAIHGKDLVKFGIIKADQAEIDGYENQ